MGWGREKWARHLSPPQHVTWILHATCADEVVVSGDVAGALLIRPLFTWCQIVYTVLYYNALNYFLTTSYTVCVCSVVCQVPRLPNSLVCANWY